MTYSWWPGQHSASLLDFSLAAELEKSPTQHLEEAYFDTDAANMDNSKVWPPAAGLRLLPPFDLLRRPLTLVLLQYRPSSAYDSPYWTTNAGAPVWNNNNSVTVGSRGAYAPCRDVPGVVPGL